MVMCDMKNLLLIIYHILGHMMVFYGRDTCMFELNLHVYCGVR